MGSTAVHIYGALVLILSGLSREVIISCTFYFISGHISLETAESVTNKVISEQAAPLRDNIKTHAKAAILPSIHDKFNAAQEEVLPKHEGERTG